MSASIPAEIYDSSLARNHIVRLVFMDMIILCDENGIVPLDRESFARRVNIPLTLVNFAVKQLEDSDPDSRRKNLNGARIVPLTGEKERGWQIVNYKEFNESLNRREYMRGYMASKRANDRHKAGNHVNFSSGESVSCICTSTEYSTDNTGDIRKGGTGENHLRGLTPGNSGGVPGKRVNGDLFDPDAVFDRERGFHPDTRAALNHLNSRTGRLYRDTERNMHVISARLRERGVDLPGVKQMIDRQVAKWEGTDMSDYLRPETLFSKTKFDGYYAARSAEVFKRSDQASVPAHIQLRVLEQEIALHAANRASTRYKPNPSPELIAELKSLRTRLHELRRTIANATSATK